MLALLVTTSLLMADWCWTVSAGADGYRLYWSNVPQVWAACNATDYPSSVCVDDRCCSTDFVDGSGDLLFYVVTAYNVAGESSTEHGPVDICP